MGDLVRWVVMSKEALIEIWNSSWVIPHPLLPARSNLDNFGCLRLERFLLTLILEMLTAKL
jgi:hypothetical protein